MSTKYYTGTGDKKQASIGPKRIEKSDPIFEAIGAVDELNAKVASLEAMLGDDKIYQIGEFSLCRALNKIKSRLFTIGAELAFYSSKNFAPKNPTNDADVKWLEENIAVMSNEFPEIKSFVLPGGCIESAFADEARTYARNAERKIISMSNNVDIENGSLFAYLNRLSSFFFVAERFINFRKGITESKPEY